MNLRCMADGHPPQHGAAIAVFAGMSLCSICYPYAEDYLRQHPEVPAIGLLDYLREAMKPVFEGLALQWVMQEVTTNAWLREQAGQRPAKRRG